MTVRVKILPKSKRVIAGVENLLDIHRKTIENGLYTVGQILDKRVTKLITSPPKTGRVYRIRGLDHQASAPGEAPANLTGRLAASFNYNVHGFYQMEVGESAPYAAFLEEGTRNIAPRPHVIRAIDETQGDVVNIFYAEFRKTVR